jgi:hypothetical protein
MQEFEQENLIQPGPGYAAQDRPANNRYQVAQQKIHASGTSGSRTVKDTAAIVLSSVGAVLSTIGGIASGIAYHNVDEISGVIRGTPVPFPYYAGQITTLYITSILGLVVSILMLLLCVTVFVRALVARAIRREVHRRLSSFSEGNFGIRDIEY